MRNIDRIALTLLFGTVFYSYFMGAYDNTPIAILGAGICTVLLLPCVQKWYAVYAKHKKRRRHGMACLRHWTLYGEGGTAKDVLQTAYPHEKIEAVELIARYPSAKPLDAQSVFNVWKKHSGADKIAILCTGAVGADAVYASHELQKPDILLLDGRALSRILSRTDLPEADLPRRKFRISLSGNPWQKIRTAAALLILYRIFGNPMYLWSGLSLFLLAGIGQKIRT